MTTVYVASKAKHAAWWKALQAAGVPITSSWLDWEGNRTDADPTADAWGRHWLHCVDEASTADICLFVCNEGETACGALLEAGAALAAGKQVFVVSHYWFSFFEHPRCRRFDSLADAIAAITAQAAVPKLKFVKR
jgi:hypothetical protein